MPVDEFEEHKTSLAIGGMMQFWGHLIKIIPFYTYEWLFAKGNYARIGNEYPLLEFSGYPVYALEPNSSSYIFPGTDVIKDGDGNPVIIPAYDQTIQSKKGHEVSFNSLGLQGVIGYQFRYRIESGNDAMKYWLNLNADPETLREPVRGKLIEIMAEMTSGDTAELMRDANLVIEARSQIDTGIQNIKKLVEPGNGYHDDFADGLKNRYGVTCIGLDISGIEYDAPSAELIRTPLDAQVEATATLTKAQATAGTADIYTDSSIRLVKKSGFKETDPGYSEKVHQTILQLHLIDNLQTMAEQQGTIIMVNMGGGQQPVITPFPGAGFQQTPSNNSSKGLEDKLNEDNLKEELNGSLEGYH